MRRGGLAVTWRWRAEGADTGASRFWATLCVLGGLCGAGCAETRSAASNDGGAIAPDAATDDAGSADDGGPSGRGGAAGGGGAGDGGGGGSASCEVPELSREPGPPLTDLEAVGEGPCASTTLGTVIDAVHAVHPELDDIRELYVPDPNRGGDQSYIYAFQTREGGFALVFRRGAGDCPAGCTENWYYYFRTGDTCEAEALGSYVPSYASGCVEVEGFPLWDHPSPLDPRTVCGANGGEPHRVDGEYHEPACGQRMPCTTKGGDEQVEALALELHFTIEQDPNDPTRARVTLLDTGHPDLDGRTLLASVERRSVHVVDQTDNLPAVCPEQHELEVLIDFEGYSNSFVHYFETKTPDCENAPGDYCKGGLELDLGNLGAKTCTASTDFLALVRREEARHGECTEDADCALVSIDRGCLGECPEAVVRADYADEMDALVQQASEAYCADASCSHDSDCSAVEAACENGRCALRAAGL